jgi:NAD(P)-dependent dehydrogenase (short-subunit alcohol dehydrogenase family)
MKKIVLITGCSSGVGLNTAVRFAKQGHIVYATMRDLTKRTALDDATQGLDVPPFILRLDVEQEESITSVVDEIVRKHGRLDVLINNAGMGTVAAFETLGEAETRRVFDINFFGAARCIKAVLPAMRAQKAGHILSVTSVGGLVGQPFTEVYCASKFALEGLIESLATYMEPFFGVKFTLVEPAGIKSAFLDNMPQKNKTPASEADTTYAPIQDRWWQAMKDRGSLERIAQTSDEVAIIVVDAVLNPTADLRILTSPIAKAFAHEKISADPTGTLLQKKIRKAFFDI